MNDNQIQVSPNAGLLDSLQTIGRLLLVVFGTIPALLTLIGTHDVLAIIAYFKSSDGATLIAAVGGIASFLYGIYKSHKRGTQVVTLTPLVPNSVATFK